MTPIRAPIPAPLSVQLYSLRKESAEDFDAVLDTVAAFGYAGVEPFNLFGKTPEAFRRQVEDLGMRISSSHYPWANRSDENELVETLEALGLERAIGGFAPDDFKDADAIRRTADTTRALCEQLGARGISLALHNHWWEFAEIDGRPGYHLFHELVPEVTFEIDTYWAANFGACDPAAEVARVRDRTPLLHIKDGPLEQEAAMVAVGSGRMDIAGVIAAADPQVLEWLVVELDRCDTDMLTAVGESYRYLTDQGLGKGRD